MSKIDLLVSTMNYTSGSINSLLDTIPDHVNVVVINQITNNSEAPSPFSIRANVTCHSFVEKGLSKSRNRALSLATGEIFVITDDDVTFLPDAFTKIEQAFKENADEDILTFQMSKPDGELRKRYKQNPFQHTRFSIAGVSSCEIAGKTTSIKAANIHYDEFFGLGAQYPVGEEVIFLRDCLQAGLKIRYMPIAISCHPEESSGRLFTRDTEFMRGAAFYRLYQGLAYAIGLIFYLKKYRLLSKNISYRTALIAYIRGIYDYKNTKKTTIYN